MPPFQADGGQNRRGRDLLRTRQVGPAPGLTDHLAPGLTAVCQPGKKISTDPVNDIAVFLMALAAEKPPEAQGNAGTSACGSVSFLPKPLASGRSAQLLALALEVTLLFDYNRVMLKPDEKPKPAPAIVLPSLFATPLGHGFRPCELSPSQSAGLQKLATLWAKVVSQLEPALERNRSVLGPLLDEFSATLFMAGSPFIAPWPALAASSKLLVKAEAVDAKEIRSLFNGLHEIALLGSLLGAYGVGPFLSRSVASLSSLHIPATPLAAALQRVYRHQLTLEAVNAQLTASGLEPLTADSFSPSLPTILKRSLEKLSSSGAPLHAKEQRIVEESLRILAHPEEKIAIATSRDLASPLAARLRAALNGAPPGFVHEAGRDLTSTSLAERGSQAQVIVVPVAELLSLSPDDISRIFIFSPLVIESDRMHSITREVLTRCRAHFSSAQTEILRSESPLFAVERTVHDTMLAEPEPAAASKPPQQTTEALPMAPAAAEPAPESPPPPPGRIRNTIAVAMPKAQENFLFDDATMQSLAPPPPPTPARVPPPKVNRASLPATVEQLNKELGITLVKPALTPRPDQLQPLFEMLESGHLRWMIKAPTGFGKTPFACLVAAVILGDSPRRPAETRRGRRLVYVTPNVDLCAQVKREILKFLELKDSDISILNGEVSTKQRRTILAGTENKILVGTPETLRKTLSAAKEADGFSSLSAMIIDEFQGAEGDHPMALLARDAEAAGVPILVQSGTPARDAEDLGEKQQLVSLKGVLVPETLQPLKNHELLNSFLPERLKWLVEELHGFSFQPYIESREQITNAKSLVRQMLGQETPTLFPSRIHLTRKPHMESFGPPSSQSFKKLKAAAQELRATVRARQAALREQGLQLCERGSQALTEINFASLNIARMSSLVSRTNLLAAAGSFAFLHDFASTWIQRWLEAPRRFGAFPAFQDFFRNSHFRSVIRTVAEGTPYIHLLQSATCADALKTAFGLPEAAITGSPQQRKSLFLDLALLEMSKRETLDHPKEAQLFSRIEELHRLGQARGIIVFAEPRYLTKHLALRLHHRFAAKGVRTAFVTGEGDGFSDRLLADLESARTGATRAAKNALGSWEEIRAAFQRQPSEPGERVDILVATSRLAVGHNLSAAAEAHIYSMHADAQKLIQQVGRVGRPDGENFFGRVGQCFYHVTRNTSEWHLFQSAIKKYQWMRTALAVSETWPEPGANEAASASESGA